MPSLATILLVVPLVWPARFVGADASCFATTDPPAPPPAPAAPVPADTDTDTAEPSAPPAAPVTDPLLRAPLAVAMWGDIALVTLPVEDAG